MAYLQRRRLFTLLHLLVSTCAYLCRLVASRALAWPALPGTVLHGLGIDQVLQQKAIGCLVRLVLLVAWRRLPQRILLGWIGVGLHPRAVGLPEHRRLLECGEPPRDTPTVAVGRIGQERPIRAFTAQ